MRDEKGQLLVGVIVMLLALAIIVPALVSYIQHEAQWSVKQSHNVTAFQLAEAAIEKGFKKVSESTTTWAAIQNGTLPAGYVFDTPSNPYTDLSGGTYAINLSSGPQQQEVTIVGVGRDAAKKEVRAIKAVYSNAPMGNIAIRGQSTITISGANVQVEWGSVVSNNTINTNNRNHPQFWSSGLISPQDANGSAPPNCDSPNCWQWHSFSNNIPSPPGIDFEYYKSSAQANGTYFAGPYNLNTKCGGSTNCDTGLIYYVDGDASVSSPGIYIRGTLIVTGNLTLPNGRAGQGSPTVDIPPQAWKQYGNDWAFYMAGGPSCTETWSDPTAPASFPGVNNSYLVNNGAPAAKTFTTGKVIVNGFFYVGGNLSQSGGGGNSIIVGAADVVGTVTIGSNNVCVFNTESASSMIQTTSIVLSRQSWQDVVMPWPSGLP